MKNTLKYISALVLSMIAVAGCIKETFPKDSTATSEQVGASSSALEAALNGIPAQMAQGYLVYGSQTHETDMAFPQFMIAMTEMLGDMYPLGSNSGYDWYRNYNTFNGTYGDNSYMAYLPWFTCYQFIKSANDIIASVDIESEETSDVLKSYAGVAYACRAFDYYMLTILFEPVENIYTDISEGRGLTAVKVTDQTDPESSKNNPRITHDEMVAFILEDLDKAEACLKNSTIDNGMLPSLAVAYGIRAKILMWDENYAEAATYARKAIETWSGTPMTKDQCLNKNTGFNTATSSWMWYGHYSAENMGNLCNFTGWMSGECDWGYASLTFPSIDRSLYDKISKDDFRKYLFYDSTTGYKYELARDPSFYNGHELLALKFRCLGGDFETYSIGGAVDFPIMRVEEMYLIEAEAVGMSQGVAAGVKLLEDFMKTYRQPTYVCRAASQRDFQLEVLTQERIEFWGEGWGFPNAKRIKPDVIQNYEGTNAPSDIFKINCKGIKPNWNLVVPKSEMDANVAIEGHNNPDPTATVTGPTPVGTFAPGN